MNEEGKKFNLQLPAHFARGFDIYLYWIMGGLLLRSRKSNSPNYSGKRRDVLFKDVLWMGIPSFLSELHIVSAPAEALPFRLPARVQERMHRYQVYRLRAEGISYFVVAREVLTAEDQGEYFDDSLLLPGLRIPPPGFASPITEL